MVDCIALGDEIATLAARLSAATHQLLTCIRRFDEGEGWGPQGAESCAHWLTWRIGLDPGTAREKVRVARALGGLPRIDQAFAGGRLSYAQVRAITRVATPENEENILMIALAATGAQLERICRRFRTAKAEIAGCVCDPDAATDRRIRARTLGGGLIKLEIVVAPDEAELILQAVARARDELRAGERGAREPVIGAAGAGGDTRVSEEASRTVTDVDGAPPPAASATSSKASRSPSVAARSITAADALVHLAATSLAGRAGDGSGLAGGAAGHYQVVVHLEPDLLPGTDGAVAASLDDGTRVSAEAFRRVACDTGIVAAVVDGRGQVLDIGRRTRAIPTAIRRALWLRDRGCRFPGCANRSFLHGHHIQHWLHGGPTSLENTLLLCSSCHRRVHEGGFTVRLDASGVVEVHAPDGARLPGTLEPRPGGHPDRDDLALWLDGWTARSPGEGGIDAWTATSSWNGDRVDYGAAVEALMEGMRLAG